MVPSVRRSESKHDDEMEADRMDYLLELLRELGITPEDTEAEGLGGYTDEQLAEAEEALRGAYDEAREGRDVERAEQIVEAVEGVRQEAAARLEAEEESEQRLADLDARLEPPAEEPEPEPEETDEPEEPDDPEAGADPEPSEEPDEPEPDDPDEPGSEGPQGVAADAGEGRQPSRPRRMPRAPASRRQPPRPERRLATITAAADVPGLTPGGSIPDIGSLAAAAAERGNALVKSRGVSGKFGVAHLSVDYPAERVIDHKDADETSRIIDRVVADAQERTTELTRDVARRPRSEDALDSLVADGGLCAPVNVSYDVFGVGDERRPIRDALPRFQATRGGIRFVAPPQLSDLAGAVDIITEAEDTAGDTDKPCLTVTCGEETEETVSAVSKCLEIGNFHHRTFREHFDRFWTLAGIQHSREAETELWDRMVAASTAVTAGQNLGFYRDFVENLIQAVAGRRSFHRIPRTVPFRVIAPEWVVEMAGADLLRQIPGDSTYDVGLAFLARSLAPHNIALSLTPDTGQEFTAQAAGPLGDWPDTVEVLVFPEGTFVFLDNGMLDFGLVRDSTLNASNNLQMHEETFEGVARPGIESLHLTMDVCPSGESSGTVDFDCSPVGS